MILLVLACSGEPEVHSRLTPIAEALSLYDQGVEALASDPAGAAELFARASEQDPGSAELQLWRGKALAASGDFEGAIAAADAALALDPMLVEALYNRGCWKARSGDLESALVDVERALEDSRVDPLDVAVDPDLAPLREAWPERLPKAELVCSSQLPGDAVFVGSEWTMSLECTHRPGEILQVEGPVVPPSIRHVKTRQRLEPAGVLESTVLEFTFVVQGADESTLGPWTLSAGALEGVAPAGVYRFLAPEGHVRPEASPSEVWMSPTAVFGHEPVERRGERVYVKAEPGDRIGWEAAEVVLYEHRLGDRPNWVGWSGVLAPGATVTVTRGGKELYGQQP